MKFKVNYITTDCILMYLGDYRILFNTPKMNEFLKIDVDWSLIDAILVSDWRYSSSLAYLSEYTLFRGIILATIPTIEFSKYFRPTYSRLCLLEYVYSNYPHEYTTFDVEEMILKIKPIYFNAPVKVVLDLSVTACSSGMTLGGSNWKIQYGSLKFVQVSEWGPGHPYSRLLDITPIVSPDALIISNPVQSKRITYNRRFPDMFSKIDQTLKARSTVLFPTATVDDLFEVLESLHHLLDSAGLQRPVHVLSKTGKHAILNASIFSEWYNEDLIISG